MFARTKTAHRAAAIANVLAIASLATLAGAGPLRPGVAVPVVDSANPPAIEVYGSNSPAGSAFSVTVSALDGSQSQPVPVELLRASDIKLNFARLAFAGTIQVTIRVPDARAYSMSPRRYGIPTQADVATRTLRFTLTNDVVSSYYARPGGSIRLIVHDHYGTSAKLFLFADRQVAAPARDGLTVFDATRDFGVSAASPNNGPAIEAAIGALSALHLPGTATLLLPAGLYATGAVSLKDDVTLYVSGRAVLFRPADVALGGGFIRFRNVRNAHIRGPGIINANLWHASDENIISMTGSSDCSLEDVTLTGTGEWSIHLLDCIGITGRNYKLVNERTDNSDGTDPDHCRRVTLDGIFEFTKDDAFAIKTSPGSSLSTDSVTVTNAVVWTEKSALKIGSEITRPTTHVRFEGCQIVSADRAFSAYGNGSGIAGGSVDGVDFAGNTIEKIQDLTAGKLVEFQVQYFANSPPYAPIRNINVSDTFSYSNSPNRSTMAGASGTPISNVRFEGFWIDDAHEMVSSTSGNVGTYFSVGSNATNITFVSGSGPFPPDSAAHVEFALASITPNPARAFAATEFAVAVETQVRLVVLDVAGREIATLAAGTYRPGRYRITWSGNAYAGRAGAGLYFIRLSGGGQSLVRRFVWSR